MWGPLDTILCYDVLEHLVDPQEVLSRLAAFAAPGAHPNVSVPNVRHLSVLYNINLRGIFGYATYGPHDSTCVGLPRVTSNRPSPTPASRSS